MAPVVLIAFGLVLAAAASFAAGIAMSRTNDTLVYLSIGFSIAAFAVLAIASVRSRAGRTRPQDEFAEARLEALERDIAAEEDVVVEDEDEVDEDLDDRIRKASAREALRKQLDLRKEIEPTDLARRPGWVQDVDGRWQRSVPATEALAAADEKLGDLEKAFAGEPVGVDAEPATVLEPDLEDEVAVGPHGDPLEGDVLELLEQDLDSQARSQVADEPPIEGYDDLIAAEIIPQLSSLDLGGLEWVWERENTGGRRPPILAQVERLIEAQRGSGPAPKEPSTTARPSTRKTPAKKTSAKRTSAKKTAAKKTAAKKTAKRTSAQKATKKATPRASRRA